MLIASGLSHVDEFLGLLSGVENSGSGKWKAYCPVHEADGGSHDPSLNIELGVDNKILLRCFACNAEVVQIVHAAGSTMSKLFPARDASATKKGKHRSGGKTEAEHIYRDEDGIPLIKVKKIRFADGSKEMPQFRSNGSGGWIIGTKKVRRVLYRLPELIAAPKDKPVFISEGETKVEALEAWGLTATCNIGGAGKWRKEDSKWFIDRDVIVLPDNDPIDPDRGTSTGLDHARDILKSLKPVAKSVRVLTLPGLPPKGGIVEWIKAGGNLPQLLELVAAPWEEAKAEQEPPKEQSIVQEMDPLDLRISQSRNDIGNARRFIRNHNGDLKYCYPWKKWLMWDGNRWAVDQKGSVFRNAKKVSELMWDEIKKFGRDVSEQTLEQVMGFAKSSSSERSICHMIHLAESEDGHQFMPSELDANPWLFNCPNGTIDLRTGEIKAHQKSDLITQMSPVKFNADATCPTWEAFLLKVFDSPEMVSYIQRLCGCWLTGIVKDETLPILWGVGSNGKTTFVNAIMEILGPDYAMKAATDFLMVKKFQGHPTEKADLFRKRFVICSETDESGRLDEAMVKDLTGREKIRARRMREDNWEFDPTHKIGLMTNHLPQIRGTDHGIWRRIRKIEFGKQFWNPDIGETGPPELMRDNTLGDRLIEEYTGILTWMVCGAIEWHQFGEMAPKSVSNWTSEYRASQDVLKTFIDECCVLGINESITVGDLYTAFSKWAKASNEFAVKKTKFGILMTERGFQRDHSDRFYLGIDSRTAEY